MQARVLSVYDEGALEDTPYVGAKGISMLVEVDGERTLFDTGMRGRYLLRNMDNLDIDVNSIDRVVISHNHKSNMGGLGKLLLERKEPLDVYVNKDFAELSKMFGRPLFMEEQAQKLNLHVMEGNTTFSKHLMAIGPFGRDSEFSLVMTTVKGPAVMTSCYHSGTKCVFDAVKEATGKNPYCMIGGLHAPKAKQETIDPTAEIMRDYGVSRVYMCHCAARAITYLRVRFGLKGISDFYVGTEAKFEV